MMVHWMFGFFGMVAIGGILYHLNRARLLRRDEEEKRRHDEWLQAEFFGTHD